MSKHHAKNERIKRKYRLWLQDARQRSERSIDQALAAIAAFEQSTRRKDFAAFHIEQARAFKRSLQDGVNPNTGKPYAKATIKARLDAVKAFFVWLADQPGYRSRIRYADCEYFNLSANDVRIATAKRERPAPSLDQVHHALNLMPHGTLIEKRDRAVLALALLTGARDDALASLAIQNLDLDDRKIVQDARTVRVKFRKTFATWFFPVGGQAEAIIKDWLACLKDELQFGPDEPLFPQTEIGLDDKGRFAPIGLKRTFWANADPIRRVFKQAFERAGLPAYNPHAIRKTLVRLGEELCTTPEAFKAWSQNLGHEDVMTTLRSYGAVSSHRQAEIMHALDPASETGARIQGSPDSSTVRWVLDHVSRSV
jgi:integrase